MSSGCLYAGVDSGGTRTSIVLLNRDGRVVGRGEGPGANRSSAGDDQFVAAITSAYDAALTSAGALKQDVVASFLCLAGFAPETEEPAVRQLVDHLFAPARCLYGRDLEAALAASCGPGEGLVVIAGTGSVAYGRKASGETRRAGGWGYLVGDEGSAYFLGSQALRMTLRSADGRIPRGALYDLVVEQSGTSDPVLLDKRIYRERWQPAAIAAYAPLVFAAAEKGDPVAVCLVNQAAKDLADQAIAVVQGLGLTTGFCGLVGGVWKAGDQIREPFLEHFRQIAPNIAVGEPPVSPAEGAALLALASDGIVRLPGT